MAEPSFDIVDHSAEILSKLERSTRAGLEACGIQAVSHAQSIITKGVPRNANSWYTSKGESGLRGSISHHVQADGKAVLIGTNNEHAAYNEYGTGKFVEGGTGRKGWWVFVPGSSVRGKNNHKIYTEGEARRIMAMLRAQGLDAHMTNGMRPLHFLKNAVADYAREYIAILKRYINGT